MNSSETGQVVDVLIINAIRKQASAIRRARASVIALTHVRILVKSRLSTSKRDNRLEYDIFLLTSH